MYHYIIVDNTKVAIKDQNVPSPLSNPEIESHPGGVYTVNTLNTRVHITESLPNSD